MSQFTDDTNLLCADLTSVENALRTVGEFGALAGLKLNIKKSKGIWLGKWEKNKLNPLQLKWLRTPVRILGIYVSYEVKGMSNGISILNYESFKQNLICGEGEILHCLVE